MSGTFDKQVDQVQKAIQFERMGNEKKAIKIYEQLIYEEFEGNFPYDRLVLIYRRNKKIADVKRVLCVAIDVFNKLSLNSPRLDVLPKLEKFKSTFNKLESKFK